VRIERKFGHHRPLQSLDCTHGQFLKSFSSSGLLYIESDFSEAVGSRMSWVQVSPKSRCQTSRGDDAFGRGNVTLVSEVLKFPILMVAVVIFNSRQETWKMFGSWCKNGVVWWFGPTSIIYMSGCRCYLGCVIIYRYMQVPASWGRCHCVLVATRL
jgi:hypothetical protein